MDFTSISLLGLILGSSWASGINLYLTTAGLGIAHRMQWITLPGELDILGHPLIIFLAILLYLIEFVADKVPYVDSAWDTVHTFIRPLGAAFLTYSAMADSPALAQTVMTLVGGTVALDSHLTKASTRVAINASPEPITNSVASVAEDSLVLGSLWLVIHHPIIIAVLVILFIAFSIWFIPKLFKLFQKLFRSLFKRNQPTHPEKKENEER